MRLIIVAATATPQPYFRVMHLDHNVSHSSHKIPLYLYTFTYHIPIGLFLKSYTNRKIILQQ